MRDEKICGTCKWHKREKGGDDWVCTHASSDHYADYTDYNHKCEEWEGRQ